MAYACQRHRGAVLDASVLVDDAVDAAYHRREDRYVLCQASQSGIGTVLSFLGLQVFHNVDNGFQRAAQVEELLLLKMRVR